MNSKLEKAKRKVEEAIEAIDTFTQTSPPAEIDGIRVNQIKLMRRYLGDMLDSLDDESRERPIVDHNMGWVIVDSWPLIRQGEKGSALALLGQRILEAEQAYNKVVASRKA